MLSFALSMVLHWGKCIAITSRESFSQTLASSRMTVSMGEDRAYERPKRAELFL
jgi:hypothetical protein